MKFEWIAAVAVVVAFIAPAANADELVVRPALGYAGVLEGMKSGFEAASGDTIKVAGANDAADLTIQLKPQFEALVKDGKVSAASVTDIARVRIGLAVKAGAPKPDIATLDRLKAVLLAAKSVGLSRFASGQYVTGELLPLLGIAEQMKAKLVYVASGPVGEAVARGDAEVGFQQMGELIPVKGITVAGAVPDSAQPNIILSAGVSTETKAAAAAQRFIAYAKSPAAAAAYKAMDTVQVK